MPIPSARRPWPWLTATLLLVALPACVTEFDLGTDPTATTGTPSPTPTETPGTCAGLPAAAYVPIPAPTSALEIVKHFNRCFRLATSSPGACTLTLEGASATEIPMGTRLFLHQVQDGIAPMSGPTTIVVLGSSDAGIFDVVTVSASNVVNTTLLVDVRGWPLSTTYSSGATRMAQACLFPTFESLALSDTQFVVASSFTPSRGGGVLAFEVLGSLILDGGVDASGRGFRGGPTNLGSPSNAPLVTTLDTDTVDGARKGEGVEPRSFTASGRGSRAGAGGGNARHAGGGGGAGFGVVGANGLGGDGGRASQAADGIDSPMDTMTFGYGGGPINQDPRRRLYFGGGGGGGHRSSLSVDPAGGAGGGIVLVLTSSLSGTGRIIANGSVGGDGGYAFLGAAGGGGGGGGAGGTIVLRARIGAFNGDIRALGGTGGGVDNQTVSDQGPGGGGGGGLVLTTGFTFAGDPLVTGGTRGVNFNLLTQGSSHGANNGFPGVVNP